MLKRKTPIRIAPMLFAALLLIALCSSCTNPGAPSAKGSQAPHTEGSSAEYQGGIPRMSCEDYPKVDGSTATLPLALALMQAVTGCSEAKAESATFFHTTDSSYEALAGSEYYPVTDMLLAYEASDTTKRELAGYNEFQIIAIGRDALVFLVNEDNPVQSLTSAQLRDIYAGKITNWKELGGDDQEIMAFQRQELSGSQTLMKKLLMKGVEMAAPRDGMVSLEMRGLVDAIGSFDASANAIGYSVYYYAHNMYDLPGVRLLAVDGVIPSNETIQSGAYPYINEFFCVLPRFPAPNAKLIADWLVSAEGQAFIRENGYVPVH